MCVIVKRWEGVELDVSGWSLILGERGGCTDVNRIISWPTEWLSACQERFCCMEPVRNAEYLYRNFFGVKEISSRGASLSCGTQFAHLFCAMTKESSNSTGHPRRQTLGFLQLRTSQQRFHNARDTNFRLSKVNKLCGPSAWPCAMISVLKWLVSRKSRAGWTLETVRNQPDACRAFFGHCSSPLEDLVIDGKDNNKPYLQ